MVWFKRVFAVALLAVVIYFFWPLIGEIRAAAGLLRNARWSWLVIALLIQALSYGFLTWLNALALRPFGGSIGFWRLGALLTAMAFIQIAIPSGGASGAALRVRLLRRYGYTPEDSLFSLFVESISEIIALATIALLGLFYLLQQRSLTIDSLAWSLLVMVTVSLAVWLGLRLIIDEAKSLRLLLWFVQFWNRRFSRLRWLEEAGLAVRLQTFRTSLRRYREVPAWKFALAAYGKVILDAACLGAGFALVGFSLPAGTLLSGYGLILVFSGAAALPGGLGVTDASVPVIFSWLRVPAAVALVAGLTYRLIAFWLVRFIGFFAWQYLEAGPRRRDG